MNTYAKELRRRETPTESRVWHRLRNRQLGGLKFRRQQPIGPYIVDFYCAEVKLIVEVDGDRHCLAGQPERDQKRQAFLESEGFTVLRVTTDDVLNNMDGVLMTIFETVHPLS